VEASPILLVERRKKWGCGWLFYVLMDLAAEDPPAGPQNARTTCGGQPDHMRYCLTRPPA
jgi:hypothetical protein